MQSHNHKGNNVAIRLVLLFIYLFIYCLFSKRGPFVENVVQLSLLCRRRYIFPKRFASVQPLHPYILTGFQFLLVKYSRTSVARTLMARLPRLFRARA